MKKPEALKLLGLQEQFSQEDLVRNYKIAYRNASLANRLKEVDKSVVAEKLNLINKAYMSLDSTSKYVPVHDHGLLLNLGTDLTNFRPTQPSNFDVFPEFQRLLNKAEELIENKQRGLALRILEIGIKRSFELNRYKGFSGQKNLLRALGKLLLEIGIRDKGVELITAGSINYYIGKTYFEIKDYQSAIKYFGREIQDRQAKVSSVDILMNIVKCYFLLGEYKNALHIVERVLPNFDSSKKSDIQLNEKMSKMLLLAISKEENLSKGALMKFKLKLKYPVSYRCISQNFSSFKDTLEFLNHFHTDEAFNHFRLALEPKFEEAENVNMEYKESLLNEVFYEIFQEPINASQLYTKR